MKKKLHPLYTPQLFKLWLLQDDRSVLIDTFPNEAAVNKHINKHLSYGASPYKKQAVM